MKRSVYCNHTAVVPIEPCTVRLIYRRIMVSMARSLTTIPRVVAHTRWTRLLCVHAAPSAPSLATGESAVVYTTSNTDAAARPSFRSRGADPEYQAAAQELRKRVLASKRRIRASPILRLERVAVGVETQRAIESGLTEAGLSARKLRRASRRGETARAPESREKRLARRKTSGAPVVLPPPSYDDHECARSYAAIRAPGTFAANVHVMSELQRLRPNFLPDTLLDFGAGIGVGLSAAARVFQTPGDTDEDAGDGNEEGKGTSLERATLVEQSKQMRALGAPIAAADPNVNGSGVNVTWVSSMREAGRENDQGGYALVVASYSLCEVAKSAIVSQPGDGEKTGRDARVLRAEKQLRAMVKTLWSRTRPGGFLVIIEDGTSAGFETVLFSRENVRMSGDARVVAPCLHSLKCPLNGNVDRHRLCRFVQRLNRPLYLRIAKPLPNGFEDEHFSYIVLEKKREGEDSEQEVEGWGRLVRTPLLRGKHVVLDACLKNGMLERRTVSKKSAQPGMYNVARKAKWGDVWPIEPESGAQKVNF